MIRSPGELGDMHIPSQSLFRWTAVGVCILTSFPGDSGAGDPGLSLEECCSRFCPFCVSFLISRGRTRFCVGPGAYTVWGILYEKSNKKSHILNTWLWIWGNLCSRSFTGFTAERENSLWSLLYVELSPSHQLILLCQLGTLQLISVQLSRSVVSDSLWPHDPQHARPPCPSPAPGVHPNQCPLSRWCHPTTSSSVVPFSSCPQSFPASGSFPVSQLFASGGQSIRVSPSASVFPMNTQDWSPI